MSDQITIPTELLRSLVDEDDCWFDHHGGCLAHGDLSLEPGQMCPHEEAKQLLARAEQESGRVTASRAADLPVGSVVANAHTAWIKVSTAADDLGTWLVTADELSTYDWEPQQALGEGAQVLRVGEGSGQ